jgi:hypothetical protein
VPSSTVQFAARLGSLNLQPLKSLPLNKVTGLPPLRGAFPFQGWRCALRPVHCQEAPLGLVVVPTSWPPTNFPLNTVSSLKPSSPLGERNSISPVFEIHLFQFSLRRMKSLHHNLEVGLLLRDLDPGGKLPRRGSYAQIPAPQKRLDPGRCTGRRTCWGVLTSGICLERHQHG